MDTTDTVEKLDETGIRLVQRLGRAAVFSLEHWFVPTPAGTRYRSRMLIGARAPVLRGPVDEAMRRWIFTDAMGPAWLAHNVEEVANFERFLPELYIQVLPLLSPQDGAALTHLIERFLADERNFAYTPCLLYADFAPEHILYDVDSREVAGIIDWGDLAIGDPDFDLLYLRQDYGEAFVRRLLTHYPHPDPTRLLAKLRVFDACDYVDTIVDSGDDPAARKAIDEAVAALGMLLDQE